MCACIYAYISVCVGLRVARVFACVCVRLCVCVVCVYLSLCLDVSMVVCIFAHACEFAHAEVYVAVRMLDMHCVFVFVVELL